jgi:ABC-type multidrug transport system fused ATPase/permease subunit
MLEASNISVDSLKSIFQQFIPKNQFEDFVFDYMANMVLEDQPDNENDVIALVGDFLSDQLKYNLDEVVTVSKEIYDKMLKSGLKSERKAIIAEKLDKSIKLSDMRVGSLNTITSLNFDPKSLAIDNDKVLMDFTGTDIITGKKTKSEGLRKHQEEMAKQKESLSELIIHHTRDESHKVDINIPSFTIQIGGKTLLEDAALKINFGKRYVLIGRNGIGKTTLLNYITKKELDGIPKHLQILHVEQEVIANDNVKFISKNLNIGPTRRST